MLFRSSRSFNNIRAPLFAVAFLISPAAGTAQSVYQIPPDTPPDPRYLAPGSSIELGEGGVLAYPYYNSDLLPYTLPAIVSLTATGGWIDSDLELLAGSQADFSGGTTVRAVDAKLGSQMVLRGTDFRIDDVPVASLIDLGDQASVNLADGQLLTGRLADGTPVAFSSHDWYIDESRYYFRSQPPELDAGDRFAIGTLRLVETEAELPAPGEIVADGSGEYAGRWIGEGQTLGLRGNMGLRSGFTAGPGSRLVIATNPSSPHHYGEPPPGAGEHFEAIGAEVELVTGRIGGNADLFLGAELVVTEGTVGQGLQVHAGSRLNVQGGSVANGLTAMPGGEINISGGQLGVGEPTYYYWPYANRPGLTAYSGATVNLQAGSVENGVSLFPGAQMEQTGGLVTEPPVVYAGSTYRFAGGILAGLNTNAGAVVEIEGGEFVVDGVPLGELGPNAGDSVQFDPPEGAIVTGFLPDGRGFVFSPEEGSSFAPGSLRFVRAELPAAPLGVIVVPTDEAPKSARSGQTIRVEQEGVLPDYFVAGIGSRVELVGGTLGMGSQVVGSEVVVDGGEIKSGARVYAGASVELNEGVVGPSFTAFEGSSVEVTGGVLGSYFRARGGAEVLIRGGRVKSDFVADDGSSTRLVGSEFRINGVPVDNFNTAGDTVDVSLDERQLLTGVLSDGTAIAFHYDDGDRIASGSLMLEKSAAAPIGPAVITVPNDPAPTSIGRGHQLVVQENGVVSRDFVAGPDSEVVVEGGTLEWDADIIESSLTMTNGTVRSGLRAFESSIVQSGGTMNGVELFHGSTFSMTAGEVSFTTYLRRHTQASFSGGTVRSVIIDDGSSATFIGTESEGTITVNDGGEMVFDGPSAAERISVNGRATIRGGSMGDDFYTSNSSEVTFYGSDFRLNGQPIVDFAATYDDLSDGDMISGVLSDGTPFVLKDDGGEESIENGSFTFVESPYAPGPSLLYASTSPKLLGVHQGQTVHVNSGTTLRDDFVAGPGSQVMIDGGEVGDNFEIIDATARLDEGEIGRYVGIFDGGRLEVYGGEAGSNLDIHPGGEMRVHGGDIGSLDNRGHLIVYGGDFGSLYAYDEAVTELRSGIIDSYYYDSSGASLYVAGGTMTQSISISENAVVSGGTLESELRVQYDGTVSVTGGRLLDGLQVYREGDLTISGGNIQGDVVVDEDGLLTLVGDLFRFNGEVIQGFTQLNDTMQFFPEPGLLEVAFGSIWQSFDLSDTEQSGYDYFDRDAVINLVMLNPPAVLPGDFNLDGVVNLADYSVWRDNLGAPDSALPTGSTTDGSGYVDVGDYTTWKTNYGATNLTSSAPAIQQVPEPTAAAIVVPLIGVVCFSIRCRRAQKTYPIAE